MQVMGIVQALSPKPKLHAAFPPIPDNCLTTEGAEGTEETRKRKLSVIGSFVASGLAPDVKDVSTVIPANPGSGSRAGAGIQHSRQDRRGRQT